MISKPTIASAWRALWPLPGQPGAPLWARLLLGGVLGALLALGLMSLAAMLTTVAHPNWWRASMLPNMLICICIVYTTLGTLRVAQALLPAALVERMSSVRDLGAGMCLSAFILLGITLGMGIGFTLVPPLVGFSVWGMFNSVPVALTKFAIFMLFVLLANWLWWRARLRQKALRQEAVEAQLRLLQGQIEPHFLFNTMANVHSLMDADPQRAKQMLEAFSDYLRAGLTQLRQVDTTLGAELDMARTYLELLQIRMLDRLSFSIDASAEARAARLPTLLLQPLVENAIHHGLEPKVEGGHVHIRALLANGRLAVSVTDDGMGLDAPRRSLRAGTGMALANLRERLLTRYGSGASLALAPLAVGTGATLELPYSVIA